MMYLAGPVRGGGRRIRGKSAVRPVFDASEGSMSVWVWAFLIGVVAGLRAGTPLAAVSWAARLARLPLQGTWLAFLGFAATPYVLTILAIVELVGDKLPQTPSRKAVMPFVVRIVSGGLCGAALGSAREALIGGLVAGGLGAVAGTLGGYEFRARLVKAIGGYDLPIALLEDAVAVVAAILIIVWTGQGRAP